MPIDSATGSGESIDAVLAAAAELGVELDADEAREWIEAVSREASAQLTVDVDSGVYGHQVTMADLDDEELGRFRHIASIVGIDDRPPDVLTALALSGSAAQNRVHRYPGDCDFFERVHIRAATREAACNLLAEVIHEKAMSALRGPGYRLQEVKFGSWPVSAAIVGDKVSAGSPVSWTPEQIEARGIEYHRADGERAVLSWEAAAAEPGWCKLDWVVADPGHGGVSNASNVLDATWEAADGTVTPLDGFLDPYFQEVYLEVDSIPLFSKLVKEMGADSVADFVERLTEEVYKYTVESPNYGKAARRMYNIFRLTGRYPEAAYLRELFDEPVTALYQVSAMLRTLTEAADGSDTFQTDGMVAQVDTLIMSAVQALEGRSEAEMVGKLLRLRDSVSRRDEASEFAEDVSEVRADAMSAVDAYFEKALTGVPSIKEYLEDVASRSGE
ncbi:MAG: hypothetical protein WD274_07910 [Acidimicrobiia bacterium]